MTGSLVQVSHPVPGMTQLVLDRPQKRNALSIALLEDLCVALEAARTERVVLLQGRGPVFCAGLDLHEAADRELSHRSADSISKALRILYTLPAITIAMVQGAALAGGAGLVAACDLVIADPQASFGFPETRRGLVAALVMAVLRRRLCGRYISELLLVGEPVSAQRAFEMGLVHRLVASSRMEEAALAMAHQVMLGSPLAVAHTKRLMESLEPRSIAEELITALATHIEVRDSPEAEAGIRKFLERDAK